MKTLIVIIALVSFSMLVNAQNSLNSYSLGKVPLKSFVSKPTVDRVFLHDQPLNLIRDPKSRELLSSETMDPVDKMPVLVPRGAHSLKVLKPDSSVHYSLRIIK